jgi:hypothetical protein
LGVDLALSLLGEIVYYAYFIGLVPIVAIASAGAFKSAFGRELFLGAYRCYVSARSIPSKIAAKTELVRLRNFHVRNVWQLRHSIYNHAGCADAVAKWVATLVTMAN